MEQLREMILNVKTRPGTEKKTPNRYSTSLYQYTDQTGLRRLRAWPQKHDVPGENLNDHRKYSESQKKCCFTKKKLKIFLRLTAQILQLTNNKS